MTTTTDGQERFSAIRAICIGSILLVIGAVWIVVQELLLGAGSLTASSPPVGAVGLFVALLTIVLLLQWLRVRLSLGRKELLVIYCMLVTFFPLASQGLWQRFVGIFISVNAFGSYPTHVPDHMVPRGVELVRNGDFAAGLKHWEGDASEHRYEHGQISRPAALLTNDGLKDVSELRQWLPRRGEDGNDRFAPGEKFRLAVDMKLSGMVAGSWFSSAISPDRKRWENILTNSTDSPADTLDGTGLIRGGHLAIEIPFGIDDGLWLRFRLAGQGRVELARVTFDSNEPMFRLIEGSSEIDAGKADRVPRDDTARLLYRPEGGWRRWLYDVRGYVPWSDWAKPLASWSLLWIAMFGAMFALGALLFRQWSDREKLTFPLTAIPLLLTEPDETRRWGYVPKLLRSRTLWAGVGTAVAVYSLNGLNFYNSDFPKLPLDIDLAPLFARPPLSAMLADGNGFRLRIVLLAVGVAFFMDLQLAFSLWLFYLLCKLYMLVPYYQGDLETSAWPNGPGYGVALWQFQSIGSAIGLVLVVLWLARRHIWGICRKVFRGSADIDDTQEPMPYRLAAVVLVLSMILAGVWGVIGGAGWWFGVCSVGFMLVLAVMASRVRAECAAPNMWLVPATPIVLLMAMGGMVTFGMVPMNYFLLMGNFMCAGYFLMTMPALMETFQIAKVAGIRRSVVGWVMVIGFVVAMVAGGYTLLNWGYARGVSTMRGGLTDKDDFSSVLWRWRAENSSSYNTLLRRFELRAKLDASGELTADEQTSLTALEKRPQISPSARIVPYSTALTCGLAAARLIFLRFPLHPLGYVLATTPLMTYAWGSILVAWLVRFVGLHVGGVRAIRNYIQPYMLGLILGSVLALLIWDAVGILKIAQGYTGQIYVTW